MKSRCDTEGWHQNTPWDISLAARISACHAEETGSIPVCPAIYFNRTARSSTVARTLPSQGREAGASPARVTILRMIKNVRYYWIRFYPTAEWEIVKFWTDNQSKEWMKGLDWGLPCLKQDFANTTYEIGGAIKDENVT